MRRDLYADPMSLAEISERLDRAGWVASTSRPDNGEPLLHSVAWTAPDADPNAAWNGFMLTGMLDPPHPDLVAKILERIGWDG